MTSLKPDIWWRIRRIKLRIKCFLTGGHRLSNKEWQYDCNGNIQMVCTKCFTGIVDIPLEDFKDKDKVIAIVHSFNKRKPYDPQP